MDLAEEIVLITGASSGIGLETARAFAKRGAKLILCARRLDKLEALQAELQDSHGISCLCLGLDVRDSKAIDHAIASLPAAWQAVSILVNNAGLALGVEKVYDMSAEDIDTVVDTNVKGLLYVTRAVVPGMLQRQQGHIINLGSVAGYSVYPGGTVYCASKFAVRAISEGLKIDLHGTPVRVSEVNPGMVHTDFSQVRFRGNEERAEQVYAGVNALTAHDIAETIVFCATRPAHVNISDLTVWPTDQTNLYLVNRHNQSQEA